MKQKRDMNMLIEFVMIVTIVVIVALLVFNINEDSRTDIQSEDRATSTVVNETLTTVLVTGETLAKSTVRDVTCDVSRCINSSDSAVIPIADWSDTTNCVVKWVTNSTDVVYNNTNWKCTYSIEYSDDSVRYNATISNDSAVVKIPTSLKLLVTAIIFGVILFVILKVIPTSGVNSKSELQ
jgi:hypothetical protein